MNRNTSPALDPAMTLSAEKLRELGFYLGPQPYLTDEQAAPFLFLDEPAQPRRRLWDVAIDAMTVVWIGTMLWGSIEFALWALTLVEPS